MHKGTCSTIAMQILPYQYPYENIPPLFLSRLSSYLFSILCHYSRIISVWSAACLSLATQSKSKWRSFHNAIPYCCVFCFCLLALF